jgi:hypothetical protein
VSTNPTIDKIAYMMDRMSGDDELTADDMEAMIIKVFVASFEYEHGFEADLIAALVNARYVLLCDENTSDDDDPPTLTAAEAEAWYVACQKKMYMETGANESYAEESASWPDTLPLRADWDKDFLRTLARKEVAHHLVVIDQIRAEMEKRANHEP